VFRLQRVCTRAYVEQGEFGKRFRCLSLVAAAGLAPPREGFPIAEVGVSGTERNVGFCPPSLLPFPLSRRDLRPPRHGGDFIECVVCIHPGIRAGVFAAWLFRRWEGSGSGWGFVGLRL
jgi:hypothetical protein